MMTYPDKMTNACKHCIQNKKRTHFKTDHYTPRNNSLNDKKFVLCTEDKRDTAVSPEHPYGCEPVCSGTYTHTHTHTATGTPSSQVTG